MTCIVSFFAHDCLLIGGSFITLLPLFVQFDTAERKKTSAQCKISNHTQPHETVFLCTYFEFMDHEEETMEQKRKKQWSKKQK